jgi:ribonuclease HI
MITRTENLRDDRPHFLLLADAQESGRWQFSLEPLDDGEAVEVSDIEPELQGERLELLTVIRGLEALDQPSRVTLVTSSRYVARGIRYDMDAWRRESWQWERFGRLVPIKNSDLWQRLDTAMAVHDVRCKHYRMDNAHAGSVGAELVAADASANASRRQIVNKPHFSVSSARGQTSVSTKERASLVSGKREKTQGRAVPPLGTRGVLRALPTLVRGLLQGTPTLARSG